MFPGQEVPGAYQGPKPDKQLLRLGPQPQGGLSSPGVSLV